jgi:hypothetical protein
MRSVFTLPHRGQQRLRCWQLGIFFGHMRKPLVIVSMSLLDITVRKPIKDGSYVLVLESLSNAGSPLFTSK